MPPRITTASHDASAIDIAAYAIMSNHYHLVLHIDQDTANNWSAAKVIEQWQRLFNGSVLSQRYSQQEKLSHAEQDALNQQISEWRERLMSISWFMRCLNEPIARAANTATTQSPAQLRRQPQAGHAKRFTI